MSKILSKLFGNAGGAVGAKLAGVAARFIRSNDEKAEFEKENPEKATEIKNKYSLRK